MSKYIDADKLRAEIERRKYEVFPTNDGKVRACSTPNQLQSGWLNALTWMLGRINSLQQAQQDFPTTDEEIEGLLTTHPKVEVPNKYKAPDWLWDEQEELPKMNIPSAGSGAMGTTPPKFKLDVKPVSPDVDLKVEIDFEWAKCNPTDEGMGSEYANISIEQFDALARHFYELGINARKEE